MTLSDLMLRLRAIQKDSTTHPYAQVKLGKGFHDSENTFEDFYIKQVGRDFVLVPDDAFLPRDKRRG